jgi:hypothetical protein
MHHLDHALQELESEANAYESSEGEGTGFETESEGDYEAEDTGTRYEFAPGQGEAESYEGEHDEAEGYDAESGAYEAEGDFEQETLVGDGEAVFDEVEEMEQAAALLEVQDEGELDQFLGTLVKKVGGKLGAMVPRNLQKALAANLRRVAKIALPKVGAALGNMVVPGLGGVVGAGVASNAGKMFGLELEGMSYEDQEFEVAKRVVNLGVEATKVATQTAATAPAPIVAKNAVLHAAQAHAPGLASAARSPRPARPVAGWAGGRGRTGRWYRRGRRIVIVGV